MKKVLLGLGLGLVLISSSSFAITKEEFYYQMGYEQAKKIYYEKGLKDAYEIFMQRLDAYKKDLEAIEAGKYLYQNQLLTYPRVYRILKPDGTAEIKVSGCKIEDLRSLDNIIAQGITIPTFTEDELKKLADGNNIINIDNINSQPADDLQTPIHIELKKAGYVKEALERFNVPFEERDDKYIAVFFDKKDLDSFCKTTKVCENDNKK